MEEKDNLDLATPEQKSNKRSKRILFIAGGLFAFIILGSLAATVYSVVTASSTKPQEKTTGDTRKVENQLIGTAPAEKNWQAVQELRTKKLEDGQINIIRILSDVNKSQNTPQQTVYQAPTIAKQAQQYQAPQNTKPPVTYNREPQINSQQSEFRESTTNTLKHEVSTQKVLKEFVPDKTDTNYTDAGYPNSKKKKIYIPSSVYRGVTLSGMAAPSMEYGKDNPLPILVAITSKGIAGNDKSIDLKGCFVMGSGFGDTSQEKVLVNLAKISCIDKKGQILESRISGWLIDEVDGQVGLTGHVVSKQGVVLAKTFMAGLLEGTAGILKQMSTTTSISPLGATQSIDSADVAKVAAANGFQTAGNSLAQFYMKTANKMYQVVELSPGRRVTIYLEDRENKQNILEDKDMYFNANPLR